MECEHVLHHSLHVNRDQFSLQASLYRSLSQLNHKNVGVAYPEVNPVVLCLDLAVKEEVISGELN